MPEPDGKRRRRVPKPLVAMAAPAFVHPLPTVPDMCFIDLLLRRSWDVAGAAYPDLQHQSRLLAGALEVVAPVAVCMQDILAGAGDGLQHTPG